MVIIVAIMVIVTPNKILVGKDIKMVVEICRRIFPKVQMLEKGSLDKIFLELDQNLR